MIKVSVGVLSVETMLVRVIHNSIWNMLLNLISDKWPGKWYKFHFFENILKKWSYNILWLIYAC